jgi:hypothetical protein
MSDDWQAEQLRQAQERAETQLRAAGASIDGASLGALIRYAVHCVPTGGFLRAFLANDLMEAIGRADHINIRQFKQLATFVHCDLSSQCHGSYERVDAWLAGGVTLEKVASHG